MCDIPLVSLTLLLCQLHLANISCTHIITNPPQPSAQTFISADPSFQVPLENDIILKPTLLALLINFASEYRH